MFFQERSRKKQARKLLKDASKLVAAERWKKIQQEVERGIKDNKKKADLPNRYRKALDDLERGIMEKAEKADLAGRSRKAIEELEKSIVEAAEKADLPSRSKKILDDLQSGLADTAERADLGGRSRKLFEDLQSGLMDKAEKADVAGRSKKVLEDLEERLAEAAEKADVPGRARQARKNIEKGIASAPEAAQRFAKEHNLDPDRIDFIRRLRPQQKRTGLARIADMTREHRAMTLAFGGFFLGSLVFFVVRMLRSTRREDISVSTVASESLKVAREAAVTAQKLAKSVEESISSSKVTLEKLVKQEKSAARPHVSVHAFGEEADADFVKLRVSIRNTGPGSATDVVLNASANGLVIDGSGPGIDDRIPALSPQSIADESDGVSLIKIPRKDEKGIEIAFPHDVEIQIDYSDVDDGAYWTKQVISVDPGKAPRHVGRPKFGEAE